MMPAQDETWDLIVDFSGLCAFVPEEKIQNNSVSQMHVVLVNAIEINKKNLKKQFDEVDDIAEHFPFLAFSPLHLQGLDRAESLSPTKCVRPFDGEELLLESPSSERVRLRSVGSSTSSEPGPGEETNFRWVPRIEDVFKDAGKIKRALVRPGGGEKRIIGCLHLKGGELSTILEQKDSEGRHIIYRFVPTKDAKNPVEQVLASRVRWIVQRTGESVTLISKKFGTGGEEKKVTLFPRSEGDERKKVFIQIVNLCSPSAFDYIKDRDREGMPQGESDFKWFYLLSGVGKCDHFPPVPLPVRFATKKNLLIGEAGGEPQICTGTLTNPPSQ